MREKRGMDNRRELNRRIQFNTRHVDDFGGHEEGRTRLTCDVVMALLCQVLGWLCTDWKEWQPNFCSAVSNPERTVLWTLDVNRKIINTMHSLLAWKFCSSSGDQKYFLIFMEFCVSLSCLRNPTTRLHLGPDQSTSHTHNFFLR